MKNGDTPAFPSMVNEPARRYDIGGLTKREYFTAMAIQGILANSVNQTSIVDAAKDAVQIADEILKQLKL